MKYTGTAGILYDRLKSEILVADGAFGTYYAKKYDTGSLPELANLQASDRVLAIHKEYIKAGAKIIRTNTFASNSVCLGAGFDEVRNNIKNAVDIAREAVKGTDVLVAADIGPIPGENMIEKEHIEKEYVDIVNVFKECGVDIFVFETFPELGFIDKAIENAGENGFVITQFAINQFGYSSAGFSARKLIEEAGKNSYIDACGFNCGVGPGHMKKLVQSLINRNDKYFAVLPNAGYPQVVSGRMVFDDNNAAYFSQIMHDLAEDGTDIIGGCCGTTPEYIRQMVLKTADVVHKKNASIEEEITEKKTANDVSFYKGKEGRKLIAVELAPPLGIDDEKIMDAAFLMKESGVDVLTFPDSPSGRTRADSILMAEKVSRETGMCVMPHICCRDKNAIAMRSQLLGAHINDINNFLVITGDPIPSVVRASVKSVFNFDSVGLMNIISDMNQEQFASALGTTPLSINRWENGKTMPNRMAQTQLYNFCKERELDVVEIIVNAKEYTDENHKLVLYHGSKKGIDGDIAPISRGECDFGKGFYMGTTTLQPLTLVCNEDKPKFYAVELDTTDLKVLTVDIGMDWAMLIAYYRKEMESAKGTPVYEKYALSLIHI